MQLLIHLDELSACLLAKTQDLCFQMQGEEYLVSEGMIRTLFHMLSF